MPAGAMITVKCQMCGREFLGYKLSQFCHDCKEIRRLEANREYQRKLWQARKELRPATYTCADCGMEFPMPEKGHTPKRCPDCAKERQRANKREWKAAHREKAPGSFRLRIPRGKKPALSFSDIRAIQRRRDEETGKWYSYGQIAAEPYLAQQAAEMEARRQQREGK